MRIINLFKSALCASSVFMISTVAMQTANAHDFSYWTDSSGQVVRTGYGECWQALKKTAQGGSAECGDAMAKPASRTKPVAAKAAPIVGDKDGDGVKDNRDQCPDTVANAKVDSQGCAIDSDGDGIIDAQDDCPGTVKGTAVNNRGCKLKENIDLSNVEFATGTAKISAASQTELDGIAMVLVRNDHLKFEIAGHTDSAGNYERNTKLSQRRADAVRSYLISQGVAADRLTAKGYGSDKPVASNATANGRARNRRVELVLQ